MTDIISKHARSIWLAVILLTLAGVVSATRVPVGLFPNIDYPRVVVSVDAGDRDAAQMEAEITRPVEIGLRAVPGVTGVRSVTSRGSAEVALNFQWGDDMVAAAQSTQGALATLLPTLPAGTRFNVRRSDPTIFPVTGFALTSDSLAPEALRTLAELKILPALTSVEGVAGVDILGSSPREFAVDVDPSRLQSLGISLSDVVATLGKANMVQGLGKIEDRHRLYLVLLENRVADASDLAAVPVKAAAGGSGVVTLGQIATITPSTAPAFSRVTSDGKQAVLVNVRQALKGDTVAIVKAVDARLAELHLPPSVKVTTFYDQSELVVGAANAVRDAILMGAVLAGIVLFVFLRSGRLMVITGLMLPAVLAATCLLLFALGMSFNMMTLGGMAAAVGLVVDDAVVMLEHMMRRMQEQRLSEPHSLLGAAAEMGMPLLGSTMATIVVFLPLAFISGVTGGFFKALAVTMVAALLISLLFARFVIPLVAAHWLRDKDAESADRANAILDPLLDRYGRASGRAFRRPVLFAAIVAALLAVSGYVAWRNVPSGFMPKMDEGGFVLDYKAQSGASLEDTDALLRRVETIISATPEVASYSRRTGVQLGGGLTEADEGDYFIRLKGGSRRSIEAVMTGMREKIAAEVPGLEVELIQLMEDLIGDLTAVPQPIEVKLFGDDTAALEASAKKIGERIGKISGVVEVIDGLRVAGDAISIAVDPGAAAQYGLDPDSIAAQLETAIGGTAATQVRIGAQLIDVRVRAPQDLRSDVARIENLPLIAPGGSSVRLAAVATVSIQSGQKQLTRENLAPFIAVTARLEGRDLGSAMTEIKGAVTGLKLPTSVRVDYGGLYAEQQKSFTDLSLVFGAALLLSALLITLLFERAGWTVAAISTVLLTAAAVMIGLWIMGIELNISALMGLTMVVGMVAELVIFFLAEMERDKPVTAAALLEAGKKRLRPILMSALIAVLTLAPLALGISRGAGLQQPLATAIIFGLIAAVPLVLFFLPAVMLALAPREPAPAD
ncbi:MULTISPECIES: efflux RND transporter permease subunit [Sphingomonadaceae]|uniref:efflux RND transporter permease subunit n=1 Tax=Sphingomonadales TaxID=204457 RepID=UPI000AD67E6D|nr:MULTISPECIES: efflux RND transporter permease subunit [Sphingomonadaceae]QWT15646.1 efflux RND transporter permease subunit [Sphingobium xenophagum]